MGYFSMFSTTKKLFFIAILCSPTLVAAEPPEHLVSVLAFEAVPESYRISIDSNGNGKIQLVVLGSDIDLSGVKIQLTLSNNASMNLQPDADGLAPFNIRDATLINTDRVTPAASHVVSNDATSPPPSENLYATITVIEFDLGRVSDMARAEDRGDDVIAFVSGFPVAGTSTEPFVVPLIKKGRKPFIDNLRRDVTNPRSETLVYASYDSYQKTPVPFYRVRLREDGRLTGFTVVPKVVDQELAISNSMNVSIIRDGQSVDRTISNEDGSFEFTNLEPGIYGVIAGGPPGFSAFSFELLEAAAPEFTPVSTSATVNRMAAAVAEDLVVLVTPTAMLAKALEPIERAIAESNAENFATPGSPMTNFGPGVSPAGSPAGVQGSGFGGGGFGGGGVPGGAGFGGASGFGTIGALGAVGAAAAVTSANSNAVIPPVASPAAL